ncbi:hypothetical protein BD779DRAFT_1807267 [Infundibulicybe gibba]|nr:hypothetical protein BD779DRAFT_1807267 [Infundibulicybe gibba]
MSNIPTPARAYISRIPPEILGEIFLHCLPVDSASLNTQQLLSNVCGLWYTLVHSTPALWVSLNITCNNRASRPPLHAIRTHIQRSGTRPLSFVLHANYMDSSELLLPIITALAAARQRWCNVRIDLARMTQDILDLITLGDTPLLRSIQCGVFYSSQSFPIPLRMLDHCPRLESFQWNSFGSRLLQPLKLGDTQLTSLSLRTALSISECIAILRLSPRLSSAAFHDLDSPDPSTIPHLTHHTLRTLTVVGVHFATLLAVLTLPALLDLDLKVEYAQSPLPTGWDTALSDFFERSRPMLRQLSLSAAKMPLEPALLRILIFAPHLRSLRLANDFPEHSPFAPLIIRALHPPPPPGTTLCPHLQKLVAFWISDCPEGLCGSMLRARRGAQAHANGVACIEQAHIGLESHMRGRDLMDMSKLCAEGLRGSPFEKKFDLRLGSRRLLRPLVKSAYYVLVLVLALVFALVLARTFALASTARYI